MRYVSTRGGTTPMAFSDAVMAGLAADGGLLVPETLPDISDRLDDWRGRSFVETAQAVFRLYVDDIPHEELDALIAEAFATFDHREVIPLVEVGDVRVLELFHGPTLAFKDVALQVLGRLFEHILARRGGDLNIVGATSGDTGSAAIAAVAGRANMAIFVMFPDGRTSPLQELQMTAVADANVHCLAVDGSFDDCQRMLKAAFADQDFKARHRLGAVNSVNWARILAQISYHMHVSINADGPCTLAVPTGNFGNILAGTVAREMGAPIEQLILATNENDILARFFDTGVYARGAVHQTLSPSMDIQVASNLERYLFLRFGRDPERVRAFMSAFSEHGRAKIGGSRTGENRVDEAITAVRVDAQETLDTIAETHASHGYLLDPHTAVGVAAARRTADASIRPICLATAHPAKFPETVARATGQDPPLHPSLSRLRPEDARKTPIPATPTALKSYIAEQDDLAACAGEGGTS
ncbi:MAG: threonine synthase [Gammaproteobacteria bacterium]|nr:threonine synthase [Gammaproteobacteria bacterium]MYB38305.1 threonine synthase [Gammaproteobacteria bacterium]